MDLLPPGSRRHAPPKMRTRRSPAQADEPPRICAGSRAQNAHQRRSGRICERHAIFCALECSINTISHMHRILTELSRAHRRHTHGHFSSETVLATDDNGYYRRPAISDDATRASPPIRMRFWTRLTPDSERPIRDAVVRLILDIETSMPNPMLILFR
jgi:hypothetical protein